MHGEFATHLLWLSGAVILAVLGGGLAKKLNQPRVLGALLGGILYGVLLNNTHIMQEIRSEHGVPFIQGLAELAAMLLLFKAGLESNINELVENAKTGWKVAVIGIIIPMAGGFAYTFYAVDTPWQVALFQGGVFAATSVGITAAVLGELGVLDKKYAKIIINAAVIDDVLALMVLTVCQALNMPGGIVPMELALKMGSAVGFVVIIPLISHFLAPKLVGWLSKLDVQAREAVVLGFMLLYGGLALYAGLAAIVGAYFAGVALEEHFFPGKREHDGNHAVEHFIDDLITGIGPIFFVYAGAIVNPAVFLNPTVLMHGLAFTAIAMMGKLACGLMVKEDRLIIGVGMSPRGEVGIVFATLGLTAAILTQELFGSSMIMVLLTTVATPPILTKLINQRQSEDKNQGEGEGKEKLIPAAAVAS